MSLLWLSGGIEVSFSISVIGVVFIALVIKRRAWFCVLTRVCWLDCVVVHQALDPCSRQGITAPWYTVVRIRSFAPQLVPASFLIIASFRLALTSAVCTCCFQAMHLSKVILRYVASFSSGFSPNCRLPAFCLLENLNSVADDFSMLMLTHHCSAQAAS